VRLDLGERITERVDLLAVVFVSEQAVLMALRGFIGMGWSRVQDGLILPKVGGGGFSRCPRVQFGLS
jgi:hypothetical protein